LIDGLFYLTYCKFYYNNIHVKNYTKDVKKCTTKILGMLIAENILKLTLDIMG